jgi:hypothetical protein
MVYEERKLRRITPITGMMLAAIAPQAITSKTTPRKPPTALANHEARKTTGGLCSSEVRNLSSDILPSDFYFARRSCSMARGALNPPLTAKADGTGHDTGAVELSSTLENEMKLAHGA